jgi:methionine aminotransferase
VTPIQIPNKLPDVGTTIFAVMTQLAQAHGAINLGQGFPDFDPPLALQQALTQAMVDGRNQYPPEAGILALRQQIALKSERLYGRQVNPDTDITITAGATEALFLAISSAVQAGDEAIVLDPCYDAYVPMLQLQNARVLRVPLRLPDFSVDWQRVRDAVTAKTRLIIVNTPHNPSGAVFSPADWDALAVIIRDRNIVVISDEVYEHLVFDGGAHHSVLRHPELAERSYVLSSLGKTYHCTGWRAGYCIAPPALSAQFHKLHQFTSYSAFGPAQWAFADALARAPEHYLQLPAFYQASRDRFRALLQGSRFKLLDVPGGFFQIVDYSAIRDIDDRSFSEWLVREGGVAAIPLSAFYETPPDARLLRLCFAKRDATLVAAAERLCRL